ncbi:hypothetical protein JXI42_05150 [bacterium]|nr:hypothetical protein [bacterium]
MKRLFYLLIPLMVLTIFISGCDVLDKSGITPLGELDGFDNLVKSSGSLVFYDNVSALGDWGTGNFADVWDLTRCDLTLSYTIDMSKIATSGWSVVEVGIREVGAPNLDPNEKGGFLFSRYASSAIGTPFNNNDFHMLFFHGWAYDTYNRKGDFPGEEITPIAYHALPNYAIWFDRDGASVTEDGVTYNTGGIYEVVIHYHALTDTTGAMYATINGAEQKYDLPGDGLTKVGNTFTGDMTQMQVFYARGGGGGVVDLYNISVDGCFRTIVVEGCDTSVADILYEGQLISEHIQEIYAETKNHGQFVRGVALFTNELMKAGIISGEEKGRIQSCAAQAK